MYVFSRFDKGLESAIYDVTNKKADKSQNNNRGHRLVHYISNKNQE